jgi:hypothetical protein
VADDIRNQDRRDFPGSRHCDHSSEDENPPIRNIHDHNGQAFSAKRSANCFNPQLRARADAKSQVGS